ncbi:hypothetical protein HHI36_000298 [Cryptolaemus montrouzieri]|uniref:Uncharacterized protein n=1 Tax=Cryptolaemus montrouzieri TaxID=559131 RepID=A0ABD2P4S4_9CUCU
MAKAVTIATFNDFGLKINQKFEALDAGIEVKLIKIETDISKKFKAYEKRDSELEVQNDQLREQFERLDKKHRKNNLIIHDFIKNKVEVDISEKDIRDSFKQGTGDNGSLLVELSSFRQKSDIIKNAFKLKGTGIFISPDLSPRDRQYQSTLVNHLKKVRAEGKTAQLRGNNLVIERKKNLYFGTRA